MTHAKIQQPKQQNTINPIIAPTGLEAIPFGER
jgi:hypothetical protein